MKNRGSLNRMFMKLIVVGTLFGIGGVECNLAHCLERDDQGVCIRRENT